jgi:Fanconi anemia group M protein
MASYIPRDKSDKPVIIVDSREAANRNGKKIVRELERLGAEVAVAKLDYGDYVLGGDVAVERKTIFDLASTLTQRFLFEQIFKMREAYPKALVIIEGYMGVLRKFRSLSPEALNGALFALVQNGVPLVPTIDYKDTAIFLTVAAKRLMKEAKTPATIRHRLKTETLSERQLFLLTGLPHVGPVLGRNLLKHFRTPRRVFCASKEELMEVKDIGPKTAEDIIAVLETPYAPEKGEKEV